MKIGGGKIIGAAMFAAGVAAFWLWPKSKAEVKEETVVRPVRSMVVTGRATIPELRCPGRVRAGESRDMMFEVSGRLVQFKIDRGQSVKSSQSSTRATTRRPSPRPRPSSKARSCRMNATARRLARAASQKMM